MIKRLSWLIALASLNAALAADVTFADGKVLVPLPDRFTVSQRDERLVATFGEGNSYRLEMTLVRAFDDAVTQPAYRFVDQQAAQKDGLSTRSDRHVFMERDRQVEGDGFYVMHWQIGVGACVLEMTASRPEPMSRELYDALGMDLNAIVRGIRCNVGTAMESLAAARALWSTAAPASYSYVVKNSSVMVAMCRVRDSEFIPMNPVRVSVSPGAVKVATMRGRTLPEHCRNGYFKNGYSVEGLFNRIETEEQSTNPKGTTPCLRVTYDATYGFPTKIDGDCYLDGDFPVEVKDFRVLK